jgi:o-succinylbenzoate---CoA ligase
MQDWLSARVEASPNALALSFEGESWSYTALDGMAKQLAARLYAAGVQRGDHVAVLLPNCPTYVGLIHALARLGGVLIPLNTRLTARELSWQVSFSGARYLVYTAKTAPQARTLEVEGCTVLDVAEMVDDSAGAGELPSPLPLDLEAIQAIVFTSGTTGEPKGAMLTYGNHFWGANASLYRLGLQTNDRWLSCLPLYHVGGLAVVFRSCLYGTAILLHSRFDVDAFNFSLEDENATLTSLVPTMLHRLLESRQGRSWPAMLRLILLGGAAATPELLERARAEGLPVATTYGLTEAASQVCTQPPANGLRKPGSVGRPLMFTRVRVVDDAGDPLPAGELGEITVQGPTVMAGYFRNSDATARTLRNGWLHTGDIGYLDEEGDLWLVQRRSDIIISGGENIYPAEVEAILRRYPGVVEACVVGIPDAEWGQRVAAMVQSVPSSMVSEANLLDFLRQNLAGYKVPRLITIVESLPQTASGKIERRTVAASLAGEREEARRH